MPSKRNPNKTNVSGYVDKELKAKIVASGLDESGFVEYAIIRALMRSEAINKKDLEKMMKEGRLRPTTILSLRYDKVL